MNRYLVLDLDNKDDAWYFGNKFLNDRKKWDKDIKKFRKDLDSISVISGIQNSEVHSGHIGKPTENVAMKEIAILEKIEHVESYQKVLEYGLSHISEEDRKLLEIFYFTEGKLISAMVDNFAHEYGCGVRTVYNMRRKAVMDFVGEVRVFIQD